MKQCMRSYGTANASGAQPPRAFQAFLRVRKMYLGTELLKNVSKGQEKIVGLSTSIHDY